MDFGPEQMETDGDRWGFRTGARFVRPAAWVAGLPTRVRSSLHMTAVAAALAEAADDDGCLLGFSPQSFYMGALSDVVRDEHDPDGWALEYDRFAAMTLVDARMRLLADGLLATRGNGDSVDYRLCLPTAES